MFDAGYTLYFSTISLYLRATRRALFSFVNRNLVRAKLRRSSQNNMDGSFFFLTRSYSCLLTGEHFEQRRLELPPAVISHFIFFGQRDGARKHVSSSRDTVRSIFHGVDARKVEMHPYFPNNAVVFTLKNRSDLYPVPALFLTLQGKETNSRGPKLA